MNLDDLARLRDLPTQPSAFSTGLAGAAIKRAARVQALATTAVVAGATTVVVIVAFVAGVLGMPGGSDDTPGVTVTTSRPAPQPSQTEPAGSTPSSSDTPTSSSATPSGTTPAQSGAAVPPVAPGTTARGSQQPSASAPAQVPSATTGATTRPTTSRPTRTPTRPVPTTSHPVSPSPTPTTATSPPVTSPEPTTPTDPVTTPTVAPVPACNTIGQGDLQVAGWQVEQQDGKAVVRLELHNPAENPTCQLTDSVWADVKPDSGGWQELASGHIDTLVESGDSAIITVTYSVARGCEVPSAELRVRIGQSMGPYESTELVPTPSKWFTCPRG